MKNFSVPSCRSTLCRSTSLGHGKTSFSIVCLNLRHFDTILAFPLCVLVDLNSSSVVSSNLDAEPPINSAELLVKHYLDNINYSLLHILHKPYLIWLFVARMEVERLGITKVGKRNLHSAKGIKAS